MNDIPIFKSGNAQIASTKPGDETTKTVDEITTTVAAQYATGVETDSGKKQRKPRSDIGVKRGPRGMANNTAQGQAVSGSEIGQAAGYTIDKAIVEKTASTILHTVDGILVRKVGTTVLRLGGDESLAKELASNSGLTTAECQLMSELTGVVFEKHGLLTGYAPELLLGVLITEWTIRVTLVIKRLNVMQAEMKAAKAKENVSPSSAR